MTTLYPQHETASVGWYDPSGQPVYLWTSDVGWYDDTTGNLWDWPMYVTQNAGLLVIGVTLAEAEQSIRRLGHKIRGRR